MRVRTFLCAGAIAAFALSLCSPSSTRAQGPFGAPSESSAFSIPQADVMQPAELADMLKAGSAKPLMLQVGSRVLFEQAHIAGSEYAGPGSQPEGLQLLRKRVAQLPHDTLIVLYCGCCPWNRCPNEGPAYRLLHSMGFTRVKALYIADNFGADWANKGYPVAHGR